MRHWPSAPVYWSRVPHEPHVIGSTVLIAGRQLMGHAADLPRGTSTSSTRTPRPPGASDPSATTPRADSIAAFHRCSRTEGILPALESAHALAYAAKLAPTLPKDKILLVNLSGRGDKDMATVAERSGLDFSIPTNGSRHP